MVNPTKKEESESVEMPPPPRPPTTSGSASETHDSVVSPDMSDDESGPLSANSWHGADPHSPSGSTRSANDDDEKTGDDASGDAPLPVQKRRRVTRACDECRRKKIKCDGKQPCTHCSVYSYECTYDKPSNRRRNPAPQYIEALESRLQRAEALLRKFIPDVDLSDPNLDPAVQQEFRNREQARAKLRREQGILPEKEDMQLLSMIESIGQLDLDEKGGWNYHGTSSGAVFLRRMRENFRGMLGPAGREPFLPRPERPMGLINLDSPESAGSSPFESGSLHMRELPPKEVARSLCYYSLNCATCLLRIVHLPSFYEMFDMIYDKSGEQLTTNESRSLALLYAVMALGCMYNPLDDNNTRAVAYKDALEEGFKYYSYARYLLQDITECRDMTSLQALLFMILFLQASSNLSGCYCFLGIALRSALRMGLHRNLRHQRLNPIESEVRKRVFHVIRQIDIYVSTLLGFPLLLNSDDVDQPYPTEIDDEYITKEAILPSPPGVYSFFEAFNAHTRLMETMAKVVRYIYPMKGLGQAVMKGDQPNTTYMIPYARIKEIEGELQDWYERLPAAWRPSSDGSIEVVRVRHLLRFAYAHVQLILYRPFLHYVSTRLSMGSPIDEFSYACAAACISVSRNIIHIGIEIRKQAVIIGPYWFMLYTEFFAVLSLVFYAIENPEKPGSGEVLADAKAGRDMLASMAEKTQAAERVSDALSILFEQIPERLRQAKTRPMPTKKRSAPVPKPSSLSQKGRTNVHPALQHRRSEDAGRTQTGPLGGARGSFDSMAISDNPFHDPAFAATLQELLPMDLPTRTTPDSTSTGGSSNRPHNYSAQANGHHAISKLDALMFPSDDPFAYPNQPMMGLGFQQEKRPSGHMGGQHQDSQFFVPGAFDDLDSQLLGQVPAYLMQEHAAQQGLDLPGQSYHPSSVMGIQQQRAQQLRRAQLQRQHMQEQEIDRLLAQQNFSQPDWAMFSRGGFQGL